jgi:peptidoglycan/LPS O-acetylase OafA/YrhL
MEQFTASKHLPVLDGLRGLAILLVMICHMTVLVPGTAAQSLVAQITVTGWIGVDLFFVLSGFLITGILLDTKDAPHFYKNFYIRRTLRIFPLFYAITIFSFVILPYLPLPAVKAQRFGTVGGEQWMYWIFASNFAIASVDNFRHGIMDVTWSVAIEEQFYLVWPTVVLLLGRRSLIRLCLAIIILSPIARFVAIEAGAGYVSTYVFTPLRLDGLCAGALIAIFVRDAHHIRLLGPVGARWLMAAGAIVFGGAIVAGGTAVIFGAPYMQPFGFSGLVLFFAGLLIAALYARPGFLLARFFDSRIMRMLGKYSYALYLIHLPIRAFIRDVVLKPATFALYPGGVIVGQLVFTLVSLIVVTIVAALSYHLFEKHFLKLKRFFPNEIEKKRQSSDQSPPLPPAAIDAPQQMPG